MPKTLNYYITNLSKLAINKEILDLSCIQPFYPSFHQKYDLMPIYGSNLIKIIDLSVYQGLWLKENPLLISFNERIESFYYIFLHFQAVQPKIETQTIRLNICHNSLKSTKINNTEESLYRHIIPALSILHSVLNRFHLLFPNRKSIERDCSKLQKLELLLSELKKEDHKCVIFAQMAKMLDILEKFLSIHKYSYLRLDGNTRAEQRQRTINRFNQDPVIFCLIASSQSQNLGINLIETNAVIFYDTNWNQIKNKQTKNRCHIIRQTNKPHIYRLINSFTIEENILNKLIEKSHPINLIIDDRHLINSQQGKINELFESIYKNK